jgi:hypothetical protein
MKLLRTRPRRLAVALFALGGTVVGVGGAVVPAQAHEEDGKCLAVSVWLYWSEQGRDYKVGPQECVRQTEMHTDFHLGVPVQSDEPPDGMLGGGGAEAWIPTP